MSFIGDWKFHSMGTLGENGLEYMNAEEYLNSPMQYIDETDAEAVAQELLERKSVIGTIMRFCESGEFYMLIPLPEGVSQEDIDAAVESGEINLLDGMMYEKVLSWEERDGELYCDLGIEGEIFDEPVERMTKVSDDEGFLNFMNIRFYKPEV
ncbi:MAG: hypothetical protein IJO64_04180 [Clostridia bacterium]|nr:hypothetical protein [Clostridia bacterium]